MEYRLNKIKVFFLRALLVYLYINKVNVCFKYVIFVNGSIYFFDKLYFFNKIINILVMY